VVRVAYGHDVEQARDLDLGCSQAQAAALKKLWLLAFREAQVQAFADAYLMIAACFALAFFMVPLMQKVAPPQTPSAEAH
jgi:DHA2 family multidrug resistance protein